MSAYRDQADVFYDAPAIYLAERFPSLVDPTFPPSPMPWSPPGIPTVQNWTHTWPLHLVFFEALIRDPAVKGILTQRGYGEVWSVSNGFEEDPRRRGGVEAWKWMAEQVIED